MAPVVKELAKHGDRIRSLVCTTGQHREMLDQVLELFKIVPDFDLSLMRPNQTLSQLTGDLFRSLDGVIEEVKPDWVLAQGDTTTVLVAGLVTFYHRKKFGHVEAGLRTGDKQRPFPEEINRRVADLVADAYFAPTMRSRDALIHEGVNPADVYVTGNTVIDALLDVASRPFDWANSKLKDLRPSLPLVTITAHRRESFGEPFRELCFAIRDMATAFPGTQFVYPVHLNPNVRSPVNEILSNVPNIHLIEPLDYFEIVHLMKRSTLILTDSGGIQEEAPSLGVPVLVMRETTERPEGVECGAVRLVGTSRHRIFESAFRILSEPTEREAFARSTNPYGDGTASRQIVSHIMQREGK
ncbi:MAG: UDP-N-acetylglucosamine 2-epimerase [Phycisphaerales bacterium]|nr:UDP-N-acetylglucosamine 2-epimerase [Phycisphaerales bacterium]